MDEPLGTQGAGGGTAMKRTLLVFLRTTLVGGLTFLLPIVLIGWLFRKAMVLAG